MADTGMPARLDVLRLTSHAPANLWIVRSSIFDPASNKVVGCVKPGDVEFVVNRYRSIIGYDSAVGGKMLAQATLPLNLYKTAIACHRDSMHARFPRLRQAGRRQVYRSNEHFMTSVASRSPAKDAVPVHVLIVVVGKYDIPVFTEKPLVGAAELAADLVDHWLTGKVVLPSGQALATVEVLASDPDKSVEVSSDAGTVTVEAPIRNRCAEALNAWVKRVEVTKGIGFLHWTGHGHTRAINSSGGLSLLCTGLEEHTRKGKPKQSGINWARTLARLNTVTNGQPLFCFIDACRKRAKGLEYDGIGASDLEPDETAHVFYSCRDNQSAYWLPKSACGHHLPEFEGQAFGTRAFMVALAGLGARTNDPDDIRHRIMPNEIKDGASGLTDLWMTHSGFKASVETANAGGAGRAVLAETSSPKSVIDIKPLKAARTSDTLRGKTKAATKSHSVATPFRYLVPRDPHQFRLDGGSWSKTYTLHLPYHDFPL